MSTTLRRETLAERPEPVNAAMVRVYFRQSKEEEKQKESIPIQRAECLRLAVALGLGERWVERVEYIDVDRSGDDFAGREELSRLMRDAQPGDVVLAWKQDRVGRDMIDSTAAIRELVKHRGVRLFTVETGSVPVSLDSAEQTAMVMFRGMVAQGELERIRSRTRDGLRQRARDGFACGSIPFGYRTILVDPTVLDRKQSKKRVVLDETAAPIVRRIFELYLDGSGYGSIARRLNNEGAPSPRGRGWSIGTIFTLLREPRYAGEWSYGETRVVRREGTRQVRERVPAKDVIRVQRPDLAILSPDEWARIQTLIAARHQDGAASHPRAHYPLSGTLRCGGCGTMMKNKICRRNGGKWVKRYYVCHARAVAGRCRNGWYVPSEDAEKTVLDYVCGTVLRQIETSIRDGIRAEVARVMATGGDREAEAARLSDEIETLRRERQRLVRLAAASDDPVAEVVDALRANQERAKGLEQRLAVVTRPPIDPAAAAQLEAAAVAQVERMRERLTGGEAREAMRALFPKGLVFKAEPDRWLVEGAASVPSVRSPTDGARTQAAGCPACSLAVAA